MAEPATRLALLTPHGVEAAHADALVAALSAACEAGDVAAVVLRLAPIDERGLVNLVKRLATPAQDAGAALVVACAGFAGDLVNVADRGGADGVHVDKPSDSTLRDLRGRIREGRILGAGGMLGSRHDAMAAGEAGIDYLMFGGLYPDGAAPDPELVREQTAWWAEIFETPCIAVATADEQVHDLAATGAEFVGLESALWMPEPGRVAAAQRALTAAVRL